MKRERERGEIRVMRVSKVNELFKCRTLTAGRRSLTPWIRGVRRPAENCGGEKGHGRNGWRGCRRSNAGEEKTNREKKGRQRGMG